MFNIFLKKDKMAKKVTFVRAPLIHSLCMYVYTMNVCLKLHTVIFTAASRKVKLKKSTEWRARERVGRVIGHRVESCRLIGIACLWTVQAPRLRPYGPSLCLYVAGLSLPRAFFSLLTFPC